MVITDFKKTNSGFVLILKAKQIKPDIAGRIALALSQKQEVALLIDGTKIN